MFDNKFGAKWIWCNSSAKNDEYAEFYDEFTYKSGKCQLMISADSNYTVYLNGKLCAFGQYADFPYDKVYDTVDITDLCKHGINKLAVIVWYYGIDTILGYYPGKAALCYTVTSGECALAKSSEETLSRISTAYISHRQKILTRQLGYSYKYDMTAEDEWKNGELVGFAKSVTVDQILPLRPRPIEKLVMKDVVTAKPVKRISETEVIYDLGQNNVGFLYLDCESACEQEILVSYGEHIADGRVRRLVGGRDFSAELRLRKGRNTYQHTFRRFGCRYIEISSPSPLENITVGIAPTEYPLNMKSMPSLSPLESEIYKACIRTLTLCMHEHYEDCPWREQALYAMDSRNQMLCGYYAFGEYRFPRACLQLMSRDDRKDGLLSICYPIKLDLVIPSFSLHYFTECREYLDHTSDVEFLKEIYPKLESILGAFVSRQNNVGIISSFDTVSYWNFYEWRRGLDDDDFWQFSKAVKDSGGDPTAVRRHIEPELALNALFSIALYNMELIAERLGISNDYAEKRKKLNSAIREWFYDSERGLFFDRHTNGEELLYSQLCNSLAILAGCTSPDESERIAKKLITDPTLTPISLSMKCFLYDALLKVDKSKYEDFIFEDIEKTYKPMIDLGVGTVWESEIGESDFDKAGSLCHGWSALPVYYYHILKN